MGHRPQAAVQAHEEGQERGPLRRRRERRPKSRGGWHFIGVGTGDRPSLSRPAACGGSELVSGLWGCQGCVRGRAPSICPADMAPSGRPPGGGRPSSPPARSPGTSSRTSACGATDKPGAGTMNDVTSRVAGIRGRMRALWRAGPAAARSRERGARSQRPGQLRCARPQPRYRAIVCCAVAIPCESWPKHDSSGDLPAALPRPGVRAARVPRWRAQSRSSAPPWPRSAWPSRSCRQAGPSYFTAWKGGQSRGGGAAQQGGAGSSAVRFGAATAGFGTRLESWQRQSARTADGGGHTAYR
jgi:hypothetical protein